jgi:hypothetical protein
VAETSHQCRQHLQRVGLVRRQGEGSHRRLHGDHPLSKTLDLALTRHQLESALSVEPAVDTIRRIVLDVQKEQKTVLAALSDKEIRESNGMPRYVITFPDTH